jgi:non-ribosomal peptide synthetase component F
MTLGITLQAYSHNDCELEQTHSKCAHELFEEQAVCTPDALAVDFQQQSLTYADLNRRTNQLAHYLRKLGVGYEVRVGICLERSPEMVITVLAILKAGAVYVPLATDYPEERQSYLLSDAGVSLLVVSGRRRFPAGSENVAVLDLQTEWATICAESPENLGINVDACSSAYMIYTSGTTGLPKGVMVEHLALANLVDAQRELFGVRPDDRILQFAFLTFDASIFEILMALCAGATLVLGRQEQLLPGPDLVNFIRSHEITQITVPPSVFGNLPQADFSSLSTVIFDSPTIAGLSEFLIAHEVKPSLTMKICE